MIVEPVKTKLFKKNDNLKDFIIEHISKLNDGSVLAITSKIVALSEGRVANVKNKEKIILAESDVAVKTRFVWMTLIKGMCMASAGIDESNANEQIILLPRDSFKVASELRKVLLSYYKIKNLGIVITDSRVPLLRAGSVGVALGYAGFSGINDYRKKKDLFNSKLQLTKVNVADSLANAAVFVMGEGSERKPLAVLNNVPVTFSDTINKNELAISIEDDIYIEFFQKLNKNT